MNSNPLIHAALRILPSLPRGEAVVYFLRLKSGAIYIGTSADLEQRLDDHFSGEACRTTQLDSPTSVLRLEIFLTLAEAHRREVELKGWSRPKQEALVSGGSK